MDATAIAMQRLTVMIGPRGHVHCHSLAIELMARARRARLAGATLLEAVEGQGRSGVPYRQHLFTDASPLSVVIVETPSKLARFVEEQRDLLDQSFVVLDEVRASRA